MKQVLLGQKKHFYKANLHCHTRFSDGKLTPAEIKQAYQSRGYSIVAFTDHEHLIDHSDLNDDGFLAITGAELAIKEFPEQSTLANFNMKSVHFNIYALDPHNTVTPCYNSGYDHYVYSETEHLIRHNGEYERQYEPTAINKMIRLCREQGFLVSYNHPGWSLETAQDYLKYDGCFAVEIYNHGAVNKGGMPDEHAFDDLLRAGKPIFCTACDDNHNPLPPDDPRGDSFGGWVQINAEELSYNNVLSALKEGMFYASTGPEIYSLVREGDKITVQTSDAVRVDMITRGRRTDTAIAAPGQPLREATFQLKEMDEYFRLRVTDAAGKCAYTQAYAVTE